MDNVRVNWFLIFLDDEFGEKTVSILLDGEESEMVFIDHPSTEMSVSVFFFNEEITNFFIVLNSNIINDYWSYIKWCFIKLRAILPIGKYKTSWGGDATQCQWYLSITKFPFNSCKKSTDWGG